MLRVRQKRCIRTCGWAAAACGATLMGAVLRSGLTVCCCASEGLPVLGRTRPREAATSAAVGMFVYAFNVL